MLLTRPPLHTRPKASASLDLHVLGTPPAFVLSQDQTLHCSFSYPSVLSPFSLLAVQFSRCSRTSHSLPLTLYCLSHSYCSSLSAYVFPHVDASSHFPAHPCVFPSFFRRLSYPITSRSPLQLFPPLFFNFFLEMLLGRSNHSPFPLFHWFLHSISLTTHKGIVFFCASYE